MCSNKKHFSRISILFQIKLRLIQSVLHIAVICLFTVKLFAIGRINDIGWINGILLLPLLVAQMTLLVFLSEGTNIYCDPINVRNKNKYVSIFFIHILLMGNQCLSLLDNNLSLRRQWCFWGIVAILSPIIVFLHFQIIDDYKRLSEEQVKNYITQYKMQWNDMLFCKSYEIQKRLYAFLLYMIAIGVFFRYLLIGIHMSILFLGLNAFVMIYMFGVPLKDLYALTDNRQKYIDVVGKGILISTIGYVIIYLIYNKVIKTPWFVGRTADEMGMVYLLFYVPFLKHLEVWCTMKNRMERIWDL